MSVNALTKVTLVPAAAGETPPAGATIIPPQNAPSNSAPGHMLAAAAAANLEVARQGMAAAQDMTNQGMKADHEVLTNALIATNQEAARIATAKEAAQSAAPPPKPPWEVTFTERRT